MEETAYTMNDLKKEIGMSPPWVRRMEAMKLVRPSAPKVRGRTGRLYSHGDVVNMLRLMALTMCGFRPEDARRYAELVDQFNRLTEPFLKKARPRHIDGAVLLFDLRDIYPGGDPNNIKWGELEKAITRKDGIHRLKEYDQGELLVEALQLLFAIAQIALDAVGAIKKTRRALRLAEGLEKSIEEKFLPGIKHPIFSPEEFKISDRGHRLTFQIRETLKVLEGQAKKQGEGRIKKL